jgi:hypothetical protein
MDADSSKRKIFWLLFFGLSVFGYFLPFVWGVVESFAALIVSWWLVYRTDIF